MTVDIDKLEAFFNGRQLPETHTLSECETITDCQLFVETHIAIIKALNGSPIIQPYLERLRKFAIQISK
jgi:hypothetical protein